MMKLRKILGYGLSAFLIATLLLFAAPLSDVRATDLNYQIATTGNDAMYYVNSGSWDYNSGFATDVGIGRYDTNNKQYGSGFRFPGIAVPAGSTITSAYFSVRSGSDPTAGTAVKSKIYGQDADNPGVFTSEADFKGRFGVNGGADQRTTAYVDWNDFAAWGVGIWYNSPEIKTIVQEIVDRPGWATGQAMVFTWNDWADSSADSNWRRYSHYDGGGVYAPKLFISYEETPNVATNDASNVSSSTAQLNGQVTSMGGEGTVYAYFQYGETDAYTSGNTTEQTKTGTGSFNDTIAGLTPGQTVHYRAALRYGASYSYGVDAEFVVGETSGGYDWLEGFGYRKVVALAGSSNGTVSNYQMQFNVYKGAGSSANNTIYLDNNCTNFPNDIRFTDANGLTILGYWIDPTSLTTSYASIWVNIPYIAISESTSMYTYFGSSGAASLSTTSIFPYFEDFSLDVTSGAVYTSPQYETTVFLVKNGIIYGHETYWSIPSRLFTYNLSTGVKTVVAHEGSFPYTANGRFTLWGGWYEESANVIWAAGEMASSGYSSQDSFRGTLVKWNLDSNVVQMAWNTYSTAWGEYSSVITFGDKVFMGNKGNIWWVNKSEWNLAAPANTIYCGQNYASQALTGTIAKFAIFDDTLYALSAGYSNGAIYKWNGTTWSLDMTVPAVVSTGGDAGNQEWRQTADWAWQTGDDVAYVAYVDATNKHVKIGTYAGTGTWTVLGDTGIDRTAVHAAGTNYGIKIGFSTTPNDVSSMYVFVCTGTNWLTTVQATTTYKVNMTTFTPTTLATSSDSFTSWAVLPYANGYTGEHVSNSLRVAKILAYEQIAGWTTSEGNWSTSNGVLTQISNTANATYGGIYTNTSLSSNTNRRVSVAMKMNDSASSRVGTMQILHEDVDNVVNLSLTNNGTSSAVALRAYVAGVDKTNHSADPGTLSLGTWYRVTAALTDSSPADGEIDFDNVNKVSHFTDADMTQTWTGLGLGAQDASVSFDNLFIANYIYPEPVATSTDAEQTQETVVTNTATSITSSTATLNGAISSVGSAGNATARGFQYGLTTSYGNTASNSGVFGVGVFTEDITSLIAGTVYHFRSFATFSSGTIYGNDLTFTTTGGIINVYPPTNYKISSRSETSISFTWARGSGSSQTMIRYSTSGYPTGITGGTQVYLGTGTTYTHAGLSEGNTYYYSAWGENSGTYSESYVSVVGQPSSDILATPDTFEIETLQIYGDYINPGDQLVIFSYKILWNEGLPSTLNPEDFFYIQILDGDTVVKQDRIKSWGYVPGSIYISELSPLDWGSSYTFRIMGTSNFASPPTVTYSITSSNYIGENYSYLTTWVQNLATRMQNSTYWDTLLDYSSGSKIMLNALGAQVFLTAIPGLSEKCSSLFYPTGEGPEYIVPDGELTYGTSLIERAEESHGETYWTAFENFATMFGIPIVTVAWAFWLMLYIISLVLITAVSKSLSAGIIIGLPVLLVGAQFGGIPMEAIIGVGIIGSIIFAYETVFQHA